MPLDLPQGHFANEQPAPYVRHFHDPRYGGGHHDNPDGRNVRPNNAPSQEERPIPTSAPSAPAPFVGSSAMDFPAAAGVERVMNFERPQSENGSLRYGSYAPTSSVSVAKPSAEESDALRTEAMKLVQDLQTLVEDLDIDADKLAIERQKVEVRVAEIEAGSRNLRVFVEARIRPFLLMLEKKQNLIGYCEELNTTNDNLTAVEAELANAELHGKERDGVKAKRSGLRKNQRRLIETIASLRRSSRALDKFAEGLLNEQYADARDKKLHRRESFLQGKEKRKALRKSKRLKSQFHEAGTPAYANEINELLGNIGRYAMKVFGTENLGPGKAKKRGFNEARRDKMVQRDKILRENFGYEADDGLDRQVVDPEMDAYEEEHYSEITDDNIGLRAFADLDRGQAADARRRIIDNELGPKFSWRYGAVDLLDNQPLSAAEAWKMARDIQYLQDLTATRARLNQALTGARARYYIESYPDIAGRNQRAFERVSREIDNDIFDDDFLRRMVAEWFNQPGDFAELGAFSDFVRRRTAEIEDQQAAKRCQELADFWAGQEDDEALAA